MAADADTENGEEPPMDVDAMLARAGDFHRYQYFLMFLFAIINILSSFHYYSSLYVAEVPDHWCHVTEPHPLNLTDQASWQWWTPDTGGDCYRFDVNLSSVTSLEGRGKWPVRKCDAGWDYDRVSGYESIVTEMNWVCDEMWKPALSLSLFFVGCVFGTLLLGILSDRVGRLHVLVIANMIALIANTATSFATDTVFFMSCRFVAGMATDNNFYMIYIIVLEYIRPSKRTFGLNLTIGVCYTVGCVILPWIALAIGNWRNFLLATATPLVIVPAYYLVVPESARWLLSKGRVNQAIKCFQRVALFNGRKIDQKTIEKFKLQSKATESAKAANLLGLFRTPNLRRKTCILIFKSIVLTLSYDAISRNVDGLGYNSFIMFSITSVTTLPACFIILLFQDRVGRKAMASGSLAFTGISMLIAAIVLWTRGNQDQVALLTLSFMGRLGINVAYNSGVQYAAELIPTEVRGQGVSMIHMAGYLTLFTSPYVLLSEKAWLPAPHMLLGTLAIVGALLCLLLPETLNRTLPVTLEDGEAFGEGENAWHFSCCQSTVNEATSTEVLTSRGVTRL